MGDKFYVVFNGRKTGIFNEWSGENGCNNQINKYPGALYKSFCSQEEAAECWEKMKTVDFGSFELEPGKAILFVAGCFNEETRKTAYSIILRTDKAVYHSNGIEMYPVLYGKNNGQGELDAIIKGIKLAEDKGCYDVLVCHNYPGSYAWGKGLWDAKSDGAEEYRDVIQNAICDIHFAFNVPEDDAYVATVKRMAIKTVNE